MLNGRLTFRLDLSTAPAINNKEYSDSCTQYNAKGQYQFECLHNMLFTFRLDAFLAYACLIIPVYASILFLLFRLYISDIYIVERNVYAS